MPRAAVLNSDETPSVVIDNGSGCIKAGFAGEEAPRVMLPTSELSGLTETPAMARGVVKDWDAMETYWDLAFQKLQVDTEHTNLLVTSPMFDPKDNKERLMQTLFETFSAQGVYTSAPAVFEMYAAGRENGVILGCGEQCTYALLMHEGLPDPRTLQRSDVAGAALTQHTAALLARAGGGGSPVDAATARKAKESLGVVARDASGAPPAGVADATFDMAEGRKLTVSAATRAAIGEPLFNPVLAGEQSGGLAQLISSCIRMRDRDGALESTEHGKDGTDNWYRSVVLGGGTTMLPGLSARLTHELTQYAPAGCTPEVLAIPERGNAAWVGASILSSLAVSAAGPPRQPARHPTVAPPLATRQPRHHLGRAGSHAPTQYGCSVARRPTPPDIPPQPRPARARHGL